MGGNTKWRSWDDDTADVALFIAVGSAWLGFGAAGRLGARTRALEELAEEGLIRADPDSGFEEFPAGLLLTVEDSIEADGRHTFSLQKYRSSLGAYCFYDCTARQEGDGWSYAVGAEMIS